MFSVCAPSFFFFFNDTATTEIYTLSLHDALPISPFGLDLAEQGAIRIIARGSEIRERSEEHTSELQSPCNLVCRLLLEKKKTERYPLTGAMTRAYSLFGILSISGAVHAMWRRAWH